MTRNTAEKTETGAGTQPVVAVRRIRRSKPKEWIARPERSTTGAIKFIVWVALRLGRTAARLLLYPICLYFVVFSRKPRRASSKFLAKVLPKPPTFADAFRHYHVFAACLLDRVFFLNDQTDEFDIHVHGEEIAVEMMERGKGCLLLGAHMGSFEAIRTLGRNQPGLRVTLVMYEENARKVNSVLAAINPALALEVISLGQPDSMLRVRESLDRGDFVGMLADRTLDGEGEIRLPFLGEPAAFALGPFQLAAMLKRPVVLMIGLYGGGRRYDVHFEQLADFSDVSAPENIGLHKQGPERSALVRWAAGRFADRLQHYARLSPYNWFNFYDFWK
jgi:predicted LPLAT superfamily acyltransferase